MPETTRTSQKPTKKLTMKGSKTSNERQQLPVDVSSVKQEIREEEDDIIDLTFIDLSELNPPTCTVQTKKKELVAGIKKSKDLKSQKKLRTKGTAAESVLRIVRNSRTTYKKKLENMTEKPGTLLVPGGKKKRKKAAIPNEVVETSEKVLEENSIQSEITEIPSIKLGHSSKKRMSEKEICVPQKEVECIEKKLENMTETSGTLLMPGRKKKTKKAGIPNEVVETSEKVLEENSTESEITEIPSIKLGHRSKKRMPEKEICVPQKEMEKKLENMTETPGTLLMPGRKKKRKNAGIPKEVAETSEKVLEENSTESEVTEIPSIKLGHRSNKRMPEKEICVSQKEVEKKLENMTETPGTLLMPGRKKKRKKAGIPNEVAETSEKVLVENSTESEITEIPSMKLGHISKKRMPEKEICVPQKEVECIEEVEEILPDTQSKSQEPASKIPKTSEASVDISPEIVEIKQENICEDDNTELAIIEMNSIPECLVLENKRRKIATKKNSIVPSVGNIETQGVQALKPKKKKVNKNQLPKTCIFDIRDHRITKMKSSIIPIKKKIGIIGFGPIARGIANCFQRTGHKVIVWSRNPEKLTKYTSNITLAESPAAVVEKCDLIFSCVANVDAVKEIMKAENGILKGLEGNATSKGYIEMTSIDPKTSCLFAEEISGKGGLFLEAQLQGTRISAHIGSLVILASGDRKLFQDCESCFTAIAKHVHFLNAEVGMASKANIVLNSIEGSSFACLAEILTLIENTGVDVNIFVDMLRTGCLECPQVVSRAHGMANKPKAVFIPARHMHSNMTMALDMGHTLSQPTPITSSASQFFKECIHRTIRDRDVAPLYCKGK